jgi:CheY-like chemotaxis protein
MSKQYKILAVDDEAMNLDIMTDYLIENGYQVVGAQDGLIALAMLEQNPDVDVILLDRMMPNMNGMETIAKIKSDERFCDIPVIMQTAAASQDQILEGIAAGVYYYLTKPYEEKTLLGIVSSALDDLLKKQEMKHSIHQYNYALGLLERAKFKFSTIEEARNLASFVASRFPDPDKIVLGLSELMMNAIEHGNLGITYNEKTQLVMAGTWLEEINRRRTLDAYAHRFAELSFEVTDTCFTISIRDEGDGFDFQKYMDIDPERATDPHGRGIAIANNASFDSVEYIGCGNEVFCTVRVQPENGVVS